MDKITSTLPPHKVPFAKWHETKFSAKQLENSISWFEARIAENRGRATRWPSMLNTLRAHRAEMIGK